MLKSPGDLRGKKAKECRKNLKITLIINWPKNLKETRIAMRQIKPPKLGSKASVISLTTQFWTSSPTINRDRVQDQHLISRYLT